MFIYHPDPDKAEPARLPRPRLALDGAAGGARQGPLPAPGKVRQADLSQGRTEWSDLDDL